MNNILLLEDLPEIRAWLKSLVMQVFPLARITECSDRKSTRLNSSHVVTSRMPSSA